MANARQTLGLPCFIVRAKASGLSALNDEALGL